MDFDFELFLVLATIASGFIWLVYALVFAKQRQPAEGEEVKEPLLVEYSRSLFPVFLIVLLLRSFIAEPFKIPSGSMIPTLLVGDFIIVNKFSYGVRLPVLHTKIIDTGSPARGDVVVFRYPVDPSTDYIKRVIGLPGDKVRYEGKILYINDKPVQQTLLGDYRGACGGPLGPPAEQRREALDGVEHNILVCRNRLEQKNEYVVPDGEYMVMGDNRDNSNDSRYWGYVPEVNLVGRAMFIWLSSDPRQDFLSPDRIRWGRIGTSIK
jgi:signal peptidase I